MELYLNNSFCQLLLLFARHLMPIKVDIIFEKMAKSLGLFHKALVPVDNKSRHMSWKHDLGRQIRQERDSSGMTQAELAKQLDVSRQMVGRYEAGQDAPAVDVLVEIARILDVEFQVKGITLRCEPSSKRPKLLQKQLKLEFEKPRRFEGAKIEIMPSEGKIFIKAEIPA